MRIEVHSANPGALKKKIEDDINNENLKTWQIVHNKEGHEFYTHTPEQWFRKCLLKPVVRSNPGRLVLEINWFTNSVPTEYIKGLYIGRFTEELLEHYRDYFTKLETFAK